MYKLLKYLLLLLPFWSMAQTGVTNHGGHYSGTGAPVGNSITKFVGLTPGYTYIDIVTGKVYEYRNATTLWIENMKIYPAGMQGPAGPAGPPGVCPPCPPPTGMVFPFTVVVGGAGDETPALQAAINKNAVDNIPVYFVGTIDIAGQVTINKDNYRLTIFMYGAKLKSSNQNPFTFFKRSLPINQSEALNEYSNAVFTIYGGELIGYNNQTGFDLGPSFSSRYQDITGQYLNTFITLRFALNSTVENCKATEVVNPFVATTGNWPGADNANSQCNMTTFNHCRAYMPMNGNIAFYIFASSGTSVTNGIIEGFFCNYGIFFDSNKSNVVRDATIENLHFECTNGAFGGAIKMAYAAGTITINKVYGQYASLLLDITSFTNFTTCEISNIPWWVLPASGKLIKRTGDVELYLERIMVAGPTQVVGGNVMSYIDNSGTTYQQPYYTEDPTGKIKINNKR